MSGKNETAGVPKYVTLPAVLFVLLFFGTAFCFSGAIYAGKGKRKGTEGKFTCDLKSVQRAVDKAGKRGLIRALGLKRFLPTIGDEDSGEGSCLAVPAWKVGYFTQKKCAEVIIFYGYLAEGYMWEGPPEIAFARLKGGKIKVMKKGIVLGEGGGYDFDDYAAIISDYTGVSEFFDVALIDFNKDGLDEFLLTIRKDEIETVVLFQFVKGKPRQIFSIETRSDDTRSRTHDKTGTSTHLGNPPYTVRTRKPVFKDVNGDGIEEIVVSGTTTRYSDVDHKQIISVTDEPTMTYFFNGKIFEAGK